MELIIENFNNVCFDTNQNKMMNCTNSEYLRYLKGKFSNLERFKSRMTTNLKERLENELKPISPKDHTSCIEFIEFLEINFDDAKPFSTIEAFKLENKEFQALVFSSINVPEMIKELGAKKYKVDGIETTHRRYSPEGDYIGDETYHNVYEVYEVDGKKLGLNNEKLYCLKCWCTSTNKEYFLWIDETHKNDPLSAVASTFMVHEDLIPHIKCIKRQGDILITELKDDYTPTGELVSLTKEQYFSLLTTQA
jgi:hypothetical protein